MINKTISILTITLLTGCASMDIPNIGQEGYSLQEDERRLSKRADEASEMLDDSGHLYPDPELKQYLNTISDALLPESPNQPSGTSKSR